MGKFLLVSDRLLMNTPDSQPELSLVPYCLLFKIKNRDGLDTLAPIRLLPPALLELI